MRCFEIGRPRTKSIERTTAWLAARRSQIETIGRFHTRWTQGGRVRLSAPANSQRVSLCDKIVSSKSR
jgi:hypothetical protein